MIHVNNRLTLKINLDLFVYKLTEVYDVEVCPTKDSKICVRGEYISWQTWEEGELIIEVLLKNGMDVNMGWDWIIKSYGR